MANNTTIVNSANTLSLFFKPGEDKRLFNTNSDSIFTFGDFKIYRDNNNFPLTSTTLNLHFDSFSTLETLGVENFNVPQSYYVSKNELNLPKNNPQSYSYFGSFNLEIQNSINKIIEEFPYAILASGDGIEITLYDYSTSYNQTNGKKNSTFKIPYSVITNQGNIIVNSGSTNNETFSLLDNFTDFTIQMSAASDSLSASTNVINIISYNFSGGTDAYLEFIIDNYLEYVTGSTTTLPIYIRPTKQRLAEYKLNISKLEYNLIYGTTLLVPNVETNSSEIEQNFIWPKTIDGFAPDSFGINFESFKTSILQTASDIDDTKTNIMLKTMIPENFLEMDSNEEIYRKTIQVYAHEFDQIKNYIDGIAYAHSIEYNGEESVPKKFMNKFSNLLGWRLSDSFNEIDLFEYLSSDLDGQGTSYSQFNVEIWKRILININWLYKKKGTRDALQFLFKLLGAPDALINFDEFIYKINHINPDLSGSTKINSNGFINYDQSIYAFQEGGNGRGNGQNYVNQWSPEFHPIKQIDNNKTIVGYTIYDTTGGTISFGSENILNTKEIQISFNPANAIEDSVFKFYQNTINPSTGNTGFSIINNEIRPDNITGMTLSQWLNFIYTKSINPRDRKTSGKPHIVYTYLHLKNAYLNYYYWTNPMSHKLTFLKLQDFLNLIERSFTDYTVQLIPSTTIIESKGTTYRNTIFNRQKFVYKEGINLGSEFKKIIPPYLYDNLNTIEINGKLTETLKTVLTAVTIIGTTTQTLSNTMYQYEIVGRIFSNNLATINGFDIAADIEPSFSSSITVEPPIQ